MVCFEPDPAEFNALVKKGDARWRTFKVLPFAVGGVMGPQQLHVPEDRRAASLLTHNPDMVDRFGRDNLHVPREHVTVDSWTLDALRREGHIGRVDYLKIDVEGAELDILKAGASILPDCVAAKVECSFLPQRLGQPLIWEVAQWLTAAGFEVVDLQDIHHWRRRNLPAHPYRVRADMEYSRGQIVQCDLIALKTPAAVSSDDQALRLVILSAALGFFDYGFSVMQSRAELAAQVRQSQGFDLDAELKRWSAAAGAGATQTSLKAAARGLLPLFRAWAGKLPFTPPRPPY